MGLHGKDELLVVGPTWAIEWLAAGKQPEERESLFAENATAGKFRDILEAEIFWLLQIPRLLEMQSNHQFNADRYFELLDKTKSLVSELIPSEYWDRIIQKVPITQLNLKPNSDIAGGRLGLLLRASAEHIANFSSAKDATEYAISRCNEAFRALAELESKAKEGFDNHPIWWSQWLAEKERKAPVVRDENFEALSMNYLARRVNADMLPRPRQESVHTKWLRLTEA